MKTIEEHLQDLFVGKFCRIKYISNFNENGTKFQNSESGRVISLKMSIQENLPDYIGIRFQNDLTTYSICPFLNDQIEIV